MKKRLLAMLLCICMIAALLPAAVLAVDQSVTIKVSDNSVNQTIAWNSEYKSVKYDVTLTGFTAPSGDFNYKTGDSDTRTKLVYLTWYEDAAMSAVTTAPKNLYSSVTSQHIYLGTQPSYGSRMTAGTYYFTITADDKDNGEKEESNVMTLIVTKTDHDELVTKTVSVQTAAARTGTITLADVFGTETIPAGAAFKAGTINGSNNLISSLTLSADGTLKYSSVAGATTGDTYTVTITSTNYNDMTATIVFEPTTVVGAPDAPVMQEPQNGDGHVTLNWDAPVNDGGLPVTDYYVAYSTTDDEPTDPAAWASTGSAATTYTVAQLDNATAYYFWVKASNGTKTSAASNSVTARPSPTYLTVENDRNESWDTSGETLVISTVEDLAQFNWLLSTGCCRMTILRTTHRLPEKPSSLQPILTSASMCGFLALFPKTQPLTVAGTRLPIILTSSATKRA